MQVALQDGSGLCRKNKASPREVVRLLNRMRPRKNFPAFFTSLPVAGRDGTLYNRMRATPARDRCSAKTATLGNVSNLSGYCRTQRGHTLVFSFMMDRVPVQPARALQDRMVNEVVCHDARLGGPNSITGLMRPPLYGGGPKKIIALSFDDGPSRYTHKIISRLRRLGAGATFFQLGSEFASEEAADRPGRPPARHDDRQPHGHPPRPGQAVRAAQRKEILRGVRAITSRGGPYPHLFRPPYDSYNATTLFVLRNLRMRLVLQTVDTQDWLPTATRKTIARRAIAGARPGGIILMHDGGGNRSATVEALPLDRPGAAQPRLPARERSHVAAREPTAAEPPGSVQRVRTAGTRRSSHGADRQAGRARQSLDVARDAAGPLVVAVLPRDAAVLALTLCAACVLA